MIAKVEGSEGFAVHRTYLLPDGSGQAKVSPNKAMLGVTKGGAVRLSKGSRKLVVAEGIETALSLLSKTFHDCSVWAALSASGMKALCLPDQPGRLVIAPDGDNVGREAGRDLAERAHALGWHVSFLTPPDGYDWNDVLTGKAAAA